MLRKLGEPRRGGGGDGKDDHRTGLGQKRRVLDFHGDEQILECGRAAMLGLWEEVRRFVRAAPVHVREAAAGTVRPAAGCGHAYAGEAEDAAAPPGGADRDVCEETARFAWAAL